MTHDSKPKRRHCGPVMNPEQAARIKAVRNRASMARVAMLGSFGILAVFAYLEASKPSSSAREVTEAKLLREQMETTASPTTKTAEGHAAAIREEKAEEAVRPAVENVSVSPVPATRDEAATMSDAQRLAAAETLLLAGTDSQRDAAMNRDLEMLRLAIDGKAWTAYRGLLGKSLKAALASVSQGQGLNRFDPLWSEPVFYQALLRWRTLACFSESQITEIVKDNYSGGFFMWLLTNNAAMEELLLTIQPKDDAGKVLKFLTDTWSLNEGQFKKYHSLALACAVVFDNAVPIPNPVGSAEYGAEAVVEPMKRYLWFVEKNEKGKLAAPVHHSSARDLVWVVCAPVTTSELEWAIDKLHYRRRNWGDAYGLVEYLMERAVEGLNPYKEYSFAEILKEGGICGDRSYFCVNTARAQGIPAMTIGGETDGGGHDWAGLKIDDDEWTTAVGRIGGASKGEARNPQTGETISEQEIQLWNDRAHQSLLVTLSVWRHLWLADFLASVEDDEGNADAVRLANRIGHSFTETWKELHALLERRMQLTGDPPVPNNLEEWKLFVSDMRREFKDNPRMSQLAADAELEYVFPYGEEGDARRSLLRERRRITSNSAEQADLIAASLKREADLLVKRGGKDAKQEISRLYDRALRDYGGSITGFKIMAEDYFGYLKDDSELALKAARDIELAFKRVVETGTKDWFRANTESSIYQMICGYYRTAGDPERATMLEKRYQVLLRRAKRSAL